MHRVWTQDELPVAELNRLAGSPDHQGVVAEVDLYPYADPASLLGGETALVVALDQVQDPRNLGAICRSAEARRRGGGCDTGASRGERHPGRRQGLGGGGRAPSHRSPRSLADWLADAKRAGAWVYERAPMRRHATTPSICASERCSSWGARARNPAPGHCGVRRPRVDPQAGRLESLNVGSAAAVLLFEAARQRRAD